MKHDPFLHSAIPPLMRLFDGADHRADIKLPNVDRLPDLLIWSRRQVCYCIEFEVKTSHADFLADFSKPHRLEARHTIANELFYVCPENVIDAHEIPKRAGLIWFDGENAIVKLEPEYSILSGGYGFRHSIENLTTQIHILTRCTNERAAERVEKQQRRDEIVNAAEKAVMYEKPPEDFKSLLGIMEHELDRDFSPAEKREIRKRIDKHQLGRVREIGKTGRFTLIEEEAHAA